MFIKSFSNEKIEADETDRYAIVNNTCIKIKNDECSDITLTSKVK
jgi:hypothetical protein